MSTEIAERLAGIRERMAAAAARAGRRPEQIRLIAVSKGKSPESIRDAMAAGQEDFGENYQQELSSKAGALAGAAPAPRWHFQGTLQRRKIKEILRVSNSILSVARIEELEEISRRAERSVTCLIEVNIAAEERKNGVAPEKLETLLASAEGLSNIHVEGIMGVPPAESDPRPWFARLRELAGRFAMGEISMGMSDDFEVAIEEGATMVRIGTAIFGRRGPAT